MNPSKRRRNLVPASQRANPDGKIPLCGETVDYDGKQYQIEGAIVRSGVFIIYAKDESGLAFEDVVSSDWDANSQVWAV